MALDTANIARMGYAPYASADVKSTYMYCTGDTVAAVIASGYFNGLTKILKKGDLILASCVNGGTPTCSLLVVTSASLAATVTTAVATFS